MVVEARQDIEEVKGEYLVLEEEEEAEAEYEGLDKVWEKEVEHG